MIPLKKYTSHGEVKPIFPSGRAIKKQIIVLLEYLFFFYKKIISVFTTHLSKTYIYFLQAIIFLKKQINVLLENLFFFYKKHISVYNTHLSKTFFAKSNFIFVEELALKRYLFYFVSYCRKEKGKAKTFSKISLQHKKSFVHNINNFSFYYMYR